MIDQEYQVGCCIVVVLYENGKVLEGEREGGSEVGRKGGEAKGGGGVKGAIHNNYYGSR